MQTHPVYQSKKWRRTIELSPDLREPLAELARRNDRTTSAEIRHALKQHLERAEHVSDSDDG